MAKADGDVCAPAPDWSCAVNCTNLPSEMIDAILLDMAAFHPYLTEAEEAAMKSRLFAIMADADDLARDPDNMARLFQEAKAVR